MSRLSASSAASVLRWLQSGGVQTARVQVTDTLAGAGLSASSAVAAGDVLLSVPSAATLTAKDARSWFPQSVVEAVDEYAASLGGSQSQLSDASLLACRIASDSRDSPHARYLELLPPADVPLLWPSPLRAALLRGSSTDRAAQQQASLASALHSTLATAIDRARGPPAPSLEAFCRAQASLLCRAHSGSGRPLALVPGLDLLNHAGATASAAVEHDVPTGAFQLVALRAHSAGEELTIDYGTDASHRLLRLYGFVSARTEGQKVDTAVEGEEVLLALLPSEAELADARAESVAEWRSHREALAACGLHSSTVRLACAADGRVALPLPHEAPTQTVDACSTQLQAGAAERPTDGSTAGDSAADHASALASALAVLRAAIGAQLERQAEGLAACAAVQVSQQGFLPRRCLCHVPARSLMHAPDTFADRLAPPATLTSCHLDSTPP